MSRSPVWRDAVIAVLSTLACALVVLLQGCGGGDCPADDPRCADQHDTPSPKPVCVDPRRCA